MGFNFTDSKKRRQLGRGQAWFPNTLLLRKQSTKLGVSGKEPRVVEWEVPFYTRGKGYIIMTDSCYCMAKNNTTL